MATIERIYDNVSDPTVYGNRIVTYSIDGATGNDFGDVIAFASFKQSHAIEAATSAFATTIKVRQSKVSDLGEALATLTEAVASMDSDSTDTDRTSNISESKLKNAQAILSKYGVCTLTIESNGQITYAEANKRQNDAQLALDTENNDLQQAMNLLDSFVSRRDNAFKTASRIVRKDDSTASSTIESIGS